VDGFDNRIRRRIIVANMPYCGAAVFVECLGLGRRPPGNVQLAHASTLDSGTRGYRSATLIPVALQISQPQPRNQFHPLTAGRSTLGNRNLGHPLPAGVSRLGWIEDAIRWPSLVAARADVVVGAMARPALRPRAMPGLRLATDSW